MHRIDLEAVLKAIPHTRIAVIGDVCLDAYWAIDPRCPEISVETGLPVRPVRGQCYSLGGAGNVAHNLRALGVETVSVYGVTGRDPFGYQMRDLMQALEIRTDGLLVQEETWVTHTYVKPVVDGAETHRFDFGNFNRLSDATARQLAARLAEDVAGLDAIVINQQVSDGIHRSERFQEMLQSLIVAQPDKIFLLDSRDMSRGYAGTRRKVNAFEAMRLTGSEAGPRETISLNDARAAGLKLAGEWGQPVFVTCGERGCLVVEDGRVEVIPALDIAEETDPVGAGDSMLAGIAAVLAIGGSPVAAATFGSLVAGVTVQKLRQTGTASPEEIRRVSAGLDGVLDPAPGMQMGGCKE